MAQFYPHSLSRHSVIGAELISLAEAKLYLRVDHAEEDSLIAGFIQAAREYAEDTIKASLVQQQWKLTYNYEFPPVVHLPMGKVESVITIELEDANGAITILDTASYALNRTEKKVTFTNRVIGASLSVIYQTTSSTFIEETLRQAMLGHIHALYEERGAATVPASSRDIYHHYRKIVL